ncbi:hypothetical protein E7Z59_14100 [Robertkochia marina]|uniref:Long-chain fatty acid transport protein n=1 Tax=Robertkochia marina TaxID=1227945 RepID=A0A4S3LX09_9FLAO|nr:hypothetical protein [Robertkochia marina]THD65716.1 hypothetical protein E7Z59_14100 [Robertkochia marina]TRZ46599.1 hypothetical protein D3A96_03250 [Robertkochia marina]
MKTNNNLSPPLITAALFFLIASVSCLAQRGYEYENFGNRSVLLNGNVTGSVNDLGAVYYNPARLALIKNPGFLVQGKFYEWNRITIDELVPDERFQTSNFTGIPGMIAGSFDMFNTRFYYSSISRNRLNLSLGFNSGVVSNEDDPQITPGNQLNLKVDINNRLREDWFGLTWAYKVHDGFALGASLFASYYTYSGGDGTRLIQDVNQDEVNIYESNLRFSQSSYGLYFKIAAAWIFEKWELGVNIDLPYLEIFGQGKFNFDEILATNTTLDDLFIYEDLNDLESTQKTPLSINVGAGIPIKNHRIHLNLSWYAPTGTYDRIEIPSLGGSTGEEASLAFQEKRRSIINFGAGGEIELTPKLDTYLSFSTDFSPLKEADEVLGSADGIGVSNLLAFDNYHFGGGFNWKFNRADVVFGAIFTTGVQEFNSVRDRPIDALLPTEETFKIGINRWRFLVGLNLSLRDLFGEKLNEQQ